jgi:predicted PurR-regulated permease PerM
VIFGTSVSKWLVLVALIALLWVARGVLPPFIVAAILAYVLSPLVDELAERTGAHRRMAAVGVFVVVVVAFTVLLLLAGSRLNSEVRAMERESPSIVQSVVEKMTGGQNLDLLGQNMSSRELGRRLDTAVQEELGTPSQAIQAISAGFSLLFGVLLVFLSLAYLLMDGPNFFRYALRFVPSEHRAHVEYLAIQIHHVLGRYLRGQLVLIVLMSTVTFLILEYVFHLPYALWVGIVTGILEIIPVVGPITAGAIAATIGFSQGGASQAAAIAIVYFVLRQVEDQLVMPLVVGRAVHIHPLVTIFAVLVGEKIAGVLGMILAVPIAATVKVILDYAYPPERAAPRIELPHEAGPPERLPEVATH